MVRTCVLQVPVPSVTARGGLLLSWVAIWEASEAGGVGPKVGGAHLTIRTQRESRARRARAAPREMLFLFVGPCAKPRCCSGAAWGNIRRGAQEASL